MLTTSIDLLANASATSAAQQWPGGRAVASVAGTFGGSTLALQMLGPDGITWLAIAAGVSFTAPGSTAAIDLPPATIRATVSGGTPSGLYARLARVPV